MAAFEQGIYENCLVTGQGFLSSKTKGTPGFYLRIQPYTDGPERDITWWLTDKTVEGAVWTGEKIVEGATWTGEKIVEGATWTGGKIVDGASWAGGKIADGASWVGDKVSKAMPWNW